MESIKNFEENNEIVITTTAHIPYVKCDRSKLEHLYSLDFMVEIVANYNDLLIEALSKRINDCVKHLYNHIDDIIYNDGKQIVYTRQGKIKQHSFNMPSYEMMGEAINALKKGKYKEFIKTRSWVEQTLKGLYRIESCDIHGYYFEDLISVLMLLYLNPYEEFGIQDVFISIYKKLNIKDIAHLEFSILKMLRAPVSYLNLNYVYFGKRLIPRLEISFKGG